MLTITFKNKQKTQKVCTNVKDWKKAASVIRLSLRQQKQNKTVINLETVELNFLCNVDYLYHFVNKNPRAFHGIT